MEGLLLGALLLAALAFLGWKFMVGNRQHNIATTIIAGTTSGLQQILSELNNPDVQKDLVQDAEYLLRYFFQRLGIAQFKDSSQRLKLPDIPSQALAAVEAQISRSILAPAAAPQSADFEKTKKLLASMADNFTQKMNEVQTQQQNDVDACAVPLITEVTDQLCKILYTEGTYAAHKQSFQTALTNAVDKTCAGIYNKLSGKDEGGRYLGGGCC